MISSEHSLQNFGSIMKRNEYSPVCLSFACTCTCILYSKMVSKFEKVVFWLSELGRNDVAATCWSLM